MKGKYIIVEQLGHPVPILFSSLLDHALFLQCWPKELIVSAGFFEIYSNQDNHDHHYVDVYGKSTTLKINSRPEDKIIIEGIR